MLVLRRKRDEYVEITHKSGDIMRIYTSKISGEGKGSVNLAFDDPDRNFEIQRPERVNNVNQKEGD